MISDFNHSEKIGQLQPFRDSVEYIQKFKDDGYRFIAITSLSKNDSSCSMRIEKS